MSSVIGDTPEQLGSCMTADAMMIDGKIITKQQVAELMAQAEMHRNAEIMWEKTMMAAVGEDGPSDVIKAIDKIKAERDAALAQASNLLSAAQQLSFEIACDPSEPQFKGFARLQDVMAATPQHHLHEVKAQAVEQFAKVAFDESLKQRKGILMLMTFAKNYIATSIRQGGAE